MNRWFRFLPVLGLVLLSFALIANFFIAYDDYHIVKVHFVFGLLFTATALFFLRSYAKKKTTVRRTARFGTGLLIYTLLFVGVLGVINYAAAKHELFRYDSTEQKVYTLAPQTQEILLRLEKPIVIRGFFVGGLIGDPQLENLIRRMAQVSKKVTWELIDPEKRPELVRNYKVTENKTVQIAFADEASTREVKLVSDLSEQAFANALLKLTRVGEKKVYFISGHGEPELSDETEQGFAYLREAVVGENLQVAEISLAQAKEIPADAAALVLAAPTRRLLPNEEKLLNGYLLAGGRAILLHEPKTTAVIAELAKQFGITVGEDVILDQVIELFAGPSVGTQPVVNVYGVHPIVENFSGSTLFTLASSVRKANKDIEGMVTEFAFTGENSWAETNLSLLFAKEPQAALEPEDLKGPVSLAAVYQKTLAEEAEDSTDRETRLVVFGDVDFVRNYSLRQVFNRDLFLNSLNWVVGEEQGISIRARTLRESKATITAEQVNLLFIITALLVPEGLLILGLGIWWVRRN